MKKNYKTELEYRIEQLFEKKSQSETDLILDCVSLIISGTENSDLRGLFNILDLESFIKLISFFDGTTISLPKKQELKDIIILALCYYYKEIKGYEWDKIKEQFPFEISSIKFGLRIKSFNNYLSGKLKKILNDFVKENN